MAKNQQFVTLFVVLLFSTAFIFSFSHLGVQVFANFSNTDGTFSNGTYIGALDVSGKSKNEAIQLVDEKYGEWMKGTKITLEYQEKNVPLDLQTFHLDSNQTVDSIKDGQKNTASMTIEKEKVKEQLQQLYPQLNESSFNMDKLIVALSQIASKFEIGTYNLDLYRDYLLAGQVKNDEVISKAEIVLKEEPADLGNFIEKNSKIEIPGNSTFSLLNFVKEKKFKLNLETQNLLSTGIYQVILATNFKIVERNIGNTIPEYSSLGLEARVNFDQNEDLVFTNPNKGKYFVELKQENNYLKVTLKGEKLLYNYKISIKGQQKFKPKTIVQYSPLLIPGKTLIQNNGKDSQLVKVYRDVYQGNQLINHDLISEDYYPQVYRVEIQSLTGTSPTTQQNGSPAGTTTGSQTGTNGTNSVSAPGNQTPSTANGQQGTNNSNLWGKPNEQPK